MVQTIKHPSLAIVAIIMFTGSAAADPLMVEYRTDGWVTQHFDESDTAQKHYNAVKTLRCDAKIEEHAGHLDVRYRCTDWQSLRTKTHAGAHRWEKWLQAAGFETKHSH